MSYSDIKIQWQIPIYSMYLIIANDSIYIAQGRKEDIFYIFIPVPWWCWVGPGVSQCLLSEGGQNTRPSSGSVPEQADVSPPPQCAVAEWSPECGSVGPPTTPTYSKQHYLLPCR